MVTRKYVRIDEVVELLKKNPPESAIRKLENLPARQPAPPCPDGGISQSAAARKYDVSQANISRWASEGIIPVLLRTPKQVYIDEKILAEVVKVFKRKPGRGRRPVQKKFKAA